MKLYHGSEKVIEKPIYGLAKIYNDYGRGFYCTEDVCMVKEAKEYVLQNFEVPYKSADIMIGYRADDSYFSFAQDFLNGMISYQQLCHAMYLGKLGEQVVLKSEKAFGQLQFCKSEFVNYEDWYALKARRDKEARSNYFHVGRSGVELVYDIVAITDGVSIRVEPVFSMDRSPEYWLGWALAYYQWYSSLSFEDIVRNISIRKILQLYSPYHEMDIMQFVDKINEWYWAKNVESNLKRIRNSRRLSQKELAVLTEIPLRTIQQYEQKQKNINKAQVEYLVRLSKALDCRIESLMEYIC